MNKKRPSSKRSARTAFVPRVVFRTLFKAAIPVVSATVLPACLAIHAFVNDAGTDANDAAVDQVPDVGETGDGATPDGSEDGN
jgi:hypothetical protein